LESSLKRILEYSYRTKKDLLLNSSTGMLGGKVIEHNIYNKKFDVKTFNYFDNEDFESNDRIDENRVYSTNIFGKIDTSKNDQLTNSTIFVIPISKDSGDTDKQFEKGTPNKRYETILDRNSRVLEIHEGISITMTVHGQTTLAVGDMIEVVLPTHGREEKEDKFYSGKYMIKKLRHTFSLPTKNHIISMEVSKDGFPTEIKSQEDDIINTSPTTEPTII